VGTDAHSNEVMTMRSTVRRMVRVQLRLAVAGAVVLAALTAATTGASAATTRGRTGGETAPRTPVPGFLLDRGRFMGFDAPRAGIETAPNSIDNLGRIVGSYVDDDADATYHGFLRDARGQIAGFTLDDPVTLAGARGFLLAKGVGGPLPRLTSPAPPGTWYAASTTAASSSAPTRTPTTASRHRSGSEPAYQLRSG
jgi:hypothetical protein